MGRSNPSYGIRTGRYSAPFAATGVGVASAKLRRPCPRCGAGPGWKCRRWISEKTRGCHAGGRWQYLKTLHRER